MAYLTATELRSRAKALESTSQFPDDVLDDLVDQFAGLAEQYRGVAYEPRTATETILIDDASTWARLGWPEIRDVTNITVTTPAVGGTTVTLSASDYAVDKSSGYIRFPAGFPVGAEIVVAYAHGLDAPPPRLLRACAEFVRSSALMDRSGVPRDVIAQSTADGGYTKFGTADWDAGRPTRWTEVNDLLNTLEDRRRLL